MISTLSDQLAGACLPTPTIFDLPPSWIDTYRQSTVAKQAWSRLMHYKLDAQSTASLFENQKIVPIESDAGWTSLYLRIEREAESFATPVNDAVIYVVDALGPLTLRYAPVLNLGSLHDIPVGAKMGEIVDLLIRPGDTFVIPAGAFAYKLEGTSQSASFLRFNGPVTVPLTLAFDHRSGGNTTVCFSDAELTSRHFFATLVGEITQVEGPLAPATLSDSDAATLRIGLGHLADADIHLFTKWKLIQSLARFAPSEAKHRLVQLAQGPYPNIRAYAQKALLQRKRAAA